MNIINTSLSALSSMTWQQPWWFLLALQPLLLWLLLRFIRKNKQQKFADKALLPWITVKKESAFWQRLFSRDSAYFLAWIGFALAMANPLVPDSQAKESQSKLDIMLVMDLSRSMQASDVQPSRLRRSVLEAYEFLSLVKSARVGVVVYAARAHLYVPLIRDLEALKFYLKDVDLLQLPTQGGDPAAAIALAQQALINASGKSRSQSIIWFTDGDFDVQNKQQLQRIEQVIQHDSIHTHILALATTDGAAIPLEDGTWLKANGQAVISRLNSDLLHKMAKKGGGVLSTFKNDESDWQKLYQEGILSSLKAKSGYAEDEKHTKSAMMLFLLPAIAFLFVALFPSRKAFLALAALALLMAFSTAKAEEIYLDRLQKGVEGYQTEQYMPAKRAFIQAVLTAKTKEQRAIALHNLGNVLFQLGDYKTAESLFHDALRYKPEQQQSQKNQKLSEDLHKALLRRLRNQQGQGSFALPSQNSVLFDLPEQLPSSSSAEALNTTKFSLPALPEKSLNNLLAKGLTHLKTLQKNSAWVASSQQVTKHQEINQARYHLLQLEEQMSNSSNALWKRLFEIEEGFAGKLKAPENVSGVRPW